MSATPTAPTSLNRGTSQPSPTPAAPEPLGFGVSYLRDLASTLVAAVLVCALERLCPDFDFTGDMGVFDEDPVALYWRDAAQARDRLLYSAAFGDLTADPRSAYDEVAILYSAKATLCTRDLLASLDIEVQA